MSTQNYRTKTMMLETKNVSKPGRWDVAIDVGYSGVKIFTPNCIACFPAFAIVSQGDRLNIDTESSRTRILYRHKEGDPEWLVGRFAQDALSKEDADENSMMIYDRQRYDSEMFRVLVDTALGIACTKNQYGDPTGLPIVVESGLPSKYIQSDAASLREIFEGYHSFEIRIGNEPWKHYDLVIVKGNVHVMLQPMGSFISVSTGQDGHQRAEFERYASSTTIVCDPGFGTYDCFLLKGQMITDKETFASLGMKEVLIETSRRIQEQYGVEIPIPVMQKFLEIGTFPTYDRKTLTSANVPFDSILEKCSRNVAEKALEKTKGYHLDECQYMILTGGTGEAWYPYFKDRLKGMTNLTIVPGNQNTMGILRGKNGEPLPLPFIFGNVRGYYMALFNR